MRGFEQLAPGVHRLAIGHGALGANVYLLESTAGWFLVDTAWARHADVVGSAVASLLGSGALPVAILLTHTHPDHAGSALALSRRWDAPVLVHPDEVPLLPGGYPDAYANPLDRWLLAPLLRLVPPRRLERIQRDQSLEPVASAWDRATGVPGLDDWRCIETPGHTPGHSAFYRPGDGILLTGDAVLTVDTNSVGGMVTGRTALSGPPRYATWNRGLAKTSVQELAKLEPSMLCPGHGRPVDRGAGPALRALAEGITVHA